MNIMKAEKALLLIVASSVVSEDNSVKAVKLQSHATGIDSL